MTDPNCFTFGTSQVEDGPLCERTIRACIDALPVPGSGYVTAYSEPVIARCRDALQALLPNPRRKAMERALEPFRHWLDHEVFNKLVDAAMGAANIHNPDISSAREGER